MRGGSSGLALFLGAAARNLLEEAHREEMPQAVDAGIIGRAAVLLVELAEAADRLPEPPFGLADLGAASALRVIGPERELWLQGMTSADVLAAPYGGAVAGSFLGGKGRLVAEGLIWRFPEELIVTTVLERLEALQQHLDKLLIMEDCEISPAEGLHRLRFSPGP